MKALKRYKYHLIAVIILLALMLVGVRTKMSQVSQSASELPRIESINQRDHALELFSTEKAAMSLNAEAAVDQREFILATVKRSLASEYQPRAFEIAHAVIAEANHHHMDPLFLLAVITTESKFNVKARGTHGEIGLMQVLPKTATWLGPQAGLPENYNLEDPAVNIRIGATYLAHLRHTFKNKSKRYIAAYNMGSTNVRRLVHQKTEPTIYPSRVINNYEQIYQAIAANAGMDVPVTRSLASVE